MLNPSSNTVGGVSPPALETSTLHYRLETGNIAKRGGQKGSLTRCAQKLGVFQSNLVASQPDAETIEASKQDLRQEIDLFKLELLKLILLQNNLKAQVAINQKMIEDRKAEIDESSEEVKASQADANRAQETKRCFEEYEALSKIANELHPRSTRQLKEQLVTVYKQIEELKKEDAATDRVMTVREGQFQLLIQYMTDLKRSVNNTEAQEKLLDLAQEPWADNLGNEGDSSLGTKKADSMDVDDDDDDDEDGLYGDVC